MVLCMHLLHRQHSIAPFPAARAIYRSIKSYPPLLESSLPPRGHSPWYPWTHSWWCIVLMGWLPSLSPKPPKQILHWAPTAPEMPYTLSSTYACEEGLRTSPHWVWDTTQSPNSCLAKMWVFLESLATIKNSQAILCPLLDLHGLIPDPFDYLRWNPE